MPREMRSPPPSRRPSNVAAQTWIGEVGDIQKVEARMVRVARMARVAWVLADSRRVRRRTCRHQHVSPSPGHRSPGHQSPGHRWLA